MSWGGPGHAPNYSRAVERASDKVSDAKELLLAALEHAYPIGSTVRVVHHRGHFYGKVVGHDEFGCRVVVENEHSLKRAKWWAAHVELHK